MFSLHNLRHSLAHVLAQAVQRAISPSVQLGTGPAIEHGFYYDIFFDEDQEFWSDQLKAVNKAMIDIVKEKQIFWHYTARDKTEALMIAKALEQDFKIELIEKFYEANPDTTYTFYYNAVDARMLPRLEKQQSPEYVEYYKLITELIQKLSHKDSETSSEWQVNRHPELDWPEWNEVMPLGAGSYTTEDGLPQSQAPSQWHNLEDYFITFIDLCEGWHVEDLGEINPKSFALDKIAGAYWQAQEWNPMMTRIYGLAFETPTELKDYQTMLEEAKKRDHRKLGKQLKLFTLSDLIGSGLPLFQPKWMILRKEIEDYLWELHKDRGYDRIRTPHIAKESLYEVSWHAWHYLDDMFKVHGGTSDEDFYLKPMNCPSHTQIFADNQFSYRDMPVRYFEPATVYRDEKTGELSWLTRVRAITQDDGHLFVRAAQLEAEIATIVEIIKAFYTTMGMMDGYRVSLSIRDDNKENYLGWEEVREQAESALTKVCDDMWLNYKTIEGEAAFYGPKLDFMFRDAIGREHQLATVQVDFNMPERFWLSFVNEEGEDEQPIMIHRAISGSLERFMGVMIEHFAGAFPLWMAPTQVEIIPVADPFVEYADSVSQALRSQDIRSEVDISWDSFSKKIRNAELLKIPYILIVGEKELADWSVSVRVYKTKEQYVMSLDEFVEKVVEEVRERVL